MTVSLHYTNTSLINAWFARVARVLSEKTKIIMLEILYDSQQRNPDYFLKMSNGCNHFQFFLYVPLPSSVSFKVSA